MRARVDSAVATAILAISLSGCGEGTVALGFPPDLVERGYSSALLFMQDGPAASSRVAEVHAFDLSLGGRLEATVQDEQSVRFLAFDWTLESRGLSSGQILSVDDPSGEPLDPSRMWTFNRALDPPAFEETETALARAIPWSLPKAPQPTACATAEVAGFLVQDARFLRPFAMAPIDDERIIVAGARYDMDGQTLTDGFVLDVAIEGDGARATSVGSDIIGAAVHGLAFDGDRTVYGSASDGTVFVFDTESLARTDHTGILPSGTSWALSRGVDGTLIAYDDQELDVLAAPQEPGAYVIDTSSISAAPLDAPGHVNALSVHTRDSIVAGVGAELYEWDGSRWTRVFTAEATFSDIAWVGDAGYATVARTQTVRRSADGRWMPLPNLSGTLGVRRTGVLAGGSFFGAGALGILVLWDGAQWCFVEPRPFSRAVRAAALTPDRRTAFTANYSESPTEILGIGRLRIED